MSMLLLTALLLIPVCGLLVFLGCGARTGLDVPDTTTGGTTGPTGPAGPTPTMPQMVNCPGLRVSVIEGTTGVINAGQSFNEMRTVRVQFLSAVPRISELISLSGLHIGSGSGNIGLRIYNDATQELMAAANQTVPMGRDIIVRFPITFTFMPGMIYRVGFFVQTTPANGGSGNLFAPDGWRSATHEPYNEPNNLFRILGAWDNSTDSFPNARNFGVAQITICMQR